MAVGLLQQQFHRVAFIFTLDPRALQSTLLLKRVQPCDKLKRVEVCFRRRLQPRWPHLYLWAHTHAIPWAHARPARLSTRITAVAKNAALYFQHNTQPSTAHTNGVR
eukprot:scaffold2021_cov62-Phaeocystis_antarctica.AAC.4